MVDYMLLKNRIITLLIFLTILIFSGVVWFLNNNLPSEPTKTSVQKLDEKNELVEAYWKDLISEVGPETAWNEFYKLNSTLEELTQHLNGHIFGKALFEVAGEESITVCDFSFGAGCFHEVVSSVIARDGLGSQSKIITKCTEKAKNDIAIGDCYHAYGHGVAYYFSGEDVTVPLNEECANHKKENSLSCASGVLMEYVSPGFLADSETPKFQSVEEIAAMCERVNEFFQPKCYPRLIQWWGGQLRLDMPPEEYVLVMEDFCNTLDNQVNRDSCFESIGLFVIATWVSFASEDIIKYCSFISEAGSVNKCISGGIIRIAIMMDDEIVNYRDDLNKLCSLNLSESDKAFCP